MSVNLFAQKGTKYSAHNEWIFGDRRFISFQEIVDQLQKIKCRSSATIFKKENRKQE